MTASNYDEQIIGTIDFIISYDKKMIPDRDIADLINDITKSLNFKFDVMKHNSFDIHFDMVGLEDQRWQELNSLIRVANNRQSSKVKPLDVIRNNLTLDEMSRFDTLTRQISKEATKE